MLLFPLKTELLFLNPNNLPSGELSLRGETECGGGSVRCKGGINSAVSPFILSCSSIAPHSHSVITADKVSGFN